MPLRIGYAGHVCDNDILHLLKQIILPENLQRYRASQFHDLYIFLTSACLAILCVHCCTSLFWLQKYMFKSISAFMHEAESGLTGVKNSIHLKIKEEQGLY